jgi:hypothetical protein
MSASSSGKRKRNDESLPTPSPSASNLSRQHSVKPRASGARSSVKRTRNTSISTLDPLKPLVINPAPLAVPEPALEAKAADEPVASNVDKPTPSDADDDMPRLYTFGSDHESDTFGLDDTSEAAEDPPDSPTDAVGAPPPGMGAHPRNLRVSISHFAPDLF